MFKCKQAEASECGKSCCCFDCDTRSDCKNVCSEVLVIKSPEECSDAIPEGAELAEFENNALAVIKAIADIATKKKELEEQDKKMREQLESAMEKYGVKSFENDLVKITYVAPSTKTSVDSAKLKKNHPEIYAECSKTTDVKGSVRITVK